MSSISGLLHSASEYAKGFICKSGLAVGALTAVRAGKSLLDKAGLNGVVHIFCEIASPLGEPIRKVEYLFYRSIQIFTPSIRYRSMTPHPDFDLDTCNACFSYKSDSSISEAFCSENQNWNPRAEEFFRREPVVRFYRCPLFNHVSLAGVIEETIYRWLLQQKILPFVSSCLPNPIRKVLGHPVTRIFLTSLIFAGGHLSPIGFFGYMQLRDVSYHFLAGVIFGAIAEKTGSLAIPILAHTLNNIQSLAEVAWGARFF